MLKLTRREDDTELLQRWQSGDADAGGILVRRHFAAVFRFFANKIPAEARDLTQRTFADLHGSIDRLRSAASFRAYLMRIARNNLYMNLRGRAARGRVFDPEVCTISGARDDRTPSLLMARREEERVLLTALRRIPIAAQLVLELHYWEGMRAAEIAEVIDVTPATAATRLSRARAALRATLQTLAAESHVLDSTMAGLETWAARVRGQADQSPKRLTRAWQ